MSKKSAARSLRVSPCFSFLPRQEQTLSNRLVVVDTLQLESYKTGNYVSALHELGWKSALCIEGDEEDNMNAKTGLNNVHYVDILPSRGANVYNILKRELLVLTTAGLKDLEERLAGP